MPITRKQFEMGIDTKIQEWMRKIHSFLAAHKDEAFTSGELHEYLDPSWIRDFEGKPFITFDESTAIKEEREAFNVTLEKLVGLEAVEERKIRGEYYYSYGPFPLEI